MRNRFLRLIAVSAAIAVLVASAPFAVLADDGKEPTPSSPGELIVSGNDSGLVDYREYTATYKDVPYAEEGDKVVISGAQGVIVEKAKPEDTKAEDAKAEDTKAEDTKAEVTKAEDAKAEDTKAEDTKAEDTKAEDAKAEDTKAEDTVAEDFVKAEAEFLPNFSAKTNDKDVTAKNVLNWKNGKGQIAYTIKVPKTGLYNFAVTFLPPEKGVDPEIGVAIDGKVPFDGAESIEFTRDWIYVPVEGAEKAEDDVRTTTFRADEKGNELAPEQMLTGEFVYRLATDKTGVAVDPYLFYLKAGTHTITLIGNNHPVVIKDLGFVAPEKIVSYEEYFDSSKLETVTTPDKDLVIVIQGEDASLKNDNSLVPKSTNGNLDMTPVDPYLTLINNIGGTTWQNPGQELTWNFEVKKAGYYQFGARYKQSDVVNGESWRWLKIDGKTPFAEAKALRFAYDTGWQEYTLAAEEDAPYYIWLDEGPHTVSLDVTLGELADYYARLFDITESLGDLYLQIVMVTSENPDINRDYELFSQIPSFEPTLEKASKDLRSLVEDVQKLTGARGSQYIAAMNNMDRVINQMLKGRYISHIYVGDYYTNYTTLSSWLSEMKKLPVYIDEMRFAYAGQEFNFADSNFFEDLWFETCRLYSSFVNDYSLYAEDGSDALTLKMWVNWGRDQTMALNSLVKDSFTTNEKYFVDGKPVNVNLQIVSASIINGLLADNFPDIQLHLSRTDPVNYGMRGALLDLTEFDDYEQVLKDRYWEGADEPYWYTDSTGKKQLFALPDTQSFYCMFYRTDVFEQLELEKPNTWEEFLYCATIIQRYNMNVYVPYTQITTTTTVNAGIGNLHLYPTMMMQNGQKLYNADKTATAIDTVRGIQVFEEWTDIYTDYGYQKEADFYNRLRNGSMPLGIAPYSTYMTIYSAAPEIDGRWSVALVPGTHDADCKIEGCKEESHINRTIAGGGSGAGIIKRTSNKEAAWSFLKWWTSNETQERYSSNVESIIGLLGRVATANKVAFNDLAWDPEARDILLEQWSHVQELPEVPGSYYMTRAIDQAFWSVLNDGTNAKDAINEWSQVADKEIKRKIEEYS